MSANAEDKPKRKPGRKKGSTPLPLSLLLAELKSGKTAEQIAKTYDLTPRAVTYRLNKHGLDLYGLRCYKEHRADVLAHVHSKIVGGISPDKIQKASLRDLATAATNIYNQERTERGLTTTTTNIVNINSELSAIEAEIARLEGAGVTEAEVVKDDDDWSK